MPGRISHELIESVPLQPPDIAPAIQYRLLPLIWLLQERNSHQIFHYQRAEPDGIVTLAYLTSPASSSFDLAHFPITYDKQPAPST